MIKHLRLGVCFCMAGWMCTGMQAWDKDILISTQNTSLVFSANVNDELRFSHYGDRIESDRIGEMHDVWAGMNRPAYPVFGREYNILTSMQAVHADGNPTTYLVFKDVRVDKKDNGTQTQIVLQDMHYPLEVRLNYRAYEQADIIEAWVEIIHKEKKAVTFRRFDSGFLPIRCGDVWVTHMHGSWAAETQVTSEPLMPGVKMVRNLDGRVMDRVIMPRSCFPLMGSHRKTVAVSLELPFAGAATMSCVSIRKTIIAITCMPVSVARQWNTGLNRTRYLQHPN